MKSHKSIVLSLQMLSLSYIGIYDSVNFVFVFIISL